MAVIGKDKSADIVLAFPQVSGRHAVIEPAGPGQFRVRDLDSANGTFVNRQRVKEGVVHPGDDLRFGSVRFDWAAHLPRLQADSEQPAGIILGRDPSCQVVVPDGRVSSRHLKIVPRGGQLQVTDLGSANGFSVNGTQMSSAVVNPGDAVKLGSLPVNLFELIAPKPQPLAGYVPAPRSTVKPKPPAQFSIWGIAAILVLLLGGTAVVFAARVDINKRCEIAGCGQELYSRKVFPWQLDAARREVSALHWCDRHANEPVTVSKRYLCEICGREIKTEKIQVPRKDNPRDTEVKQGVHDGPCRVERDAREAGKGAKSVAGGSAAPSKR